MLHAAVLAVCGFSAKEDLLAQLLAPNQQVVAKVDDEFRRKARALRTLCQDIVELRRGDHCAERPRLDLERVAEANKQDEVRAFKVVREETKQWPDVKQAFQAAFALYRQRKAGQPPAPGTENPGKSNGIKPDQAGGERDEIRRRPGPVIFDFARGNRFTLSASLSRPKT